MPFKLVVGFFFQIIEHVIITILNSIIVKTSQSLEHFLWSEVLLSPFIQIQKIIFCNKHFIQLLIYSQVSIQRVAVGGTRTGRVGLGLMQLYIY